MAITIRPGRTKAVAATGYSDLREMVVEGTRFQKVGVSVSTCFGSSSACALYGVSPFTRSAFVYGNTGCRQLSSSLLFSISFDREDANGRYS